MSAHSFSTARLMPSQCLKSVVAVATKVQSANNIYRCRIVLLKINQEMESTSVYQSRNSTKSHTTTLFSFKRIFTSQCLQT